jgi:EAL domain-containing protein (putative c-di-GMP-specific phosphodiesterase class I)/ActR/RegA family two-component response regulator
MTEQITDMSNALHVTEDHQIVLILDDDVMITQALSAGLARRGRTIITCNDLEGAEIIVEWLKPSHVVSDVRLTGAFGYEGLDFIRFVKRHSADTRIILMTGDAPEALQLEASERGAVGFLQKPFEVAALDSVLDMMAPPRVGSEEWPDVIHVPLLDDVLNEGIIFTAFQPIVRLASGQHVGFEALARVHTNSPLRNPETLFKYALRKHRVTDLEMVCIRTSLALGAQLAKAAPLFLNVHPTVFASGTAIRDLLLREAEKNEIDPGRIVLEITEQASLTNDRKVIDAIQQLKGTGVRFAFDDVGVAYSHLPFIDTVRPSFLKISQAFGTGFENDATRTKIIQNLMALAKDFDCDVILEGIETQATAAAALDLGLKYGQGFLFGEPAAATSFVKAPSS